MSITAASGFRAAGVWAAIKGSGKPDLALIVSDRPAAAAGVFTVNRFRSVDVELDEARLAATGGRASAIVVTSGYANTMTGPGGRRDAVAIGRAAARLLKVPEREVLISSTGAIGFRLPVPRVIRGLRKAVRALAATKEAGMAAARGIMTTDTHPKQAEARFSDGGRVFTVGGIAKGVGMVAPSMATILVYVTTDAAVPPAPLRRALVAACADTLNAITVDGQMSTNDSAICLANGAAACRALSGPGVRRFAAALHEVCAALARQLVADGEGATRLIRVSVTGALNAREAALAARAVADSALVKTMFYGRQANWGRIAQALGASGARFDPLRVTVRVGGYPAIRGGLLVKPRFELYSRLAEAEVPVAIDLGAGRARASVLTCDLTERYVRINAGYLS
ncbi:MAG: bifunctional glutamate N-acetyltransferase/amino-acid acetyltransferase ArgJ [Candidatus Coatesbacteria bacterium]